MGIYQRTVDLSTKYTGGLVVLVLRAEHFQSAQVARRDLSDH